MAGALEGIRVVELASFVSGPYAGMLLGDLGAEIIKIEAPDKGDPFRGWGRVEYSPPFGSVNRNKKSVTIDLKSPKGIEQVRKLIATADVLVENFRPGTLDRLGIGYDEVSKDNPKLVWCSITGFGPDGPYAKRPGYDTVGQAMSGLLSLVTDMNDPRPTGVSLSDHLSGMVACNGILAALVARGHTGRGQRVETSLLEASLSFCGENAARYFENAKVPGRTTRTREASVYAFLGNDGLPFIIHLSSPQKFFEGMARAAGKPEWITDERFATKEGRRKNHDTLAEVMTAVFKTGPREMWLQKLLDEDVPCARINTLAEVFEDPQVKHLGMRKDLPHKHLGTVSLVRNAIRMSDTPVEMRWAAPDLGEHNDEILGKQE
jgi:crotonobetainyl-CoA:carnitine CoA-transferase CaiB-like acyl-CoA transferase